MPRAPKQRTAAPAEARAAVASGLVQFGSSAHVYNHRQTASMLSRTGPAASRGDVYVMVNVPVSADPIATGRAIEDTLAKYKSVTNKTQLSFQ